MAPVLFETPTNARPQFSVALARQAPAFLKSQNTWSLPYPFNLFSNNESAEKWQNYESVCLACLRAGDFDSAYQCVEDLTTRFGIKNERVLALRGLYKEATANTPAEIDEVMQQYDLILEEDPTIFSIRKRRAALLRSLGKIPEAVVALTTLLDIAPTDAEAWAELADVYLSQGVYDRAIFCLEEVLLVAPNAWNVHARLGEVLFLSAARLEEAPSEQIAGYAESLRRFCRSIELCDDYLRGFYGLKLASGKLASLLSGTGKIKKTADETSVPSLATVEKLNELATSKIAEILRCSAAGEKNWDGYSPAELKAARELLNQGTQKIER